MSKRIQGITIEIDGNTSKLNEALKDTNKVIASTNSEIKALNSALKLDPKNTELLAQKQELLKKNISATTDKLNSLKEAQKQMGSYNKLTDEQKESYRALSIEISKAESSLKSMNKEAKEASKVDMSKLKSGLKNVGTVAASVASAMAKVSAAVGAALVALVSAGVKSYASLEQNIGGIQKLFGESADKVIENAKKAYKTAGLSANQYMETATSFSASLLRGLSGNTEEAARLTDIAIRDMADNANTFGTSMEEVMNVYKALSKEQYTTLDNLRLGYAGTKTGMKELIHDASTYTVIQEKLGLTVQDGVMSFDNMIRAISVMQEYLKIMGTTEKEAMGTITGSLNMMKAAFDNFLNGIGDAESLTESIKAFINNVSKAVIKLAPSLLSGIVDVAKGIIPDVIKVIDEAFPILAQAMLDLVDSVLELVKSDTGEIEKTISTILTETINYITKNTPKLIKIVLELILKVAKVLIEQIPTIIDSIVELTIEITNTLIDYLPKLIEAALLIILALAKGIIEALPKLIEQIPKIITSLVETLTKPELMVMLIQASITLMVELAKGLVQAIPELLKMVPTIISNLAKSLANMIVNTNWLKLGKDILKGILNGLLDFGTLVKDTIKKLGNKIVSSIKSFFGIHSPSTLMEDEIGNNLTAGIVEGMENSIPNAINEVNKAMMDLNNGIQSSVNPVINPTANSNPLYLTIDKFYNNRDTDIQQLAQELEFYRKNAALAKGGM